MAIVHYRQGRPKEALNYLEQVLVLDPQHEDALLASARIIEEEKIEHLNGVAFNRLAQLIQLGKDDANLYFSLAMLAVKANKPQLAKPLFEQAISRKQSFCEAHYNYALLLVKELELLGNHQTKRNLNVQLALSNLKQVFAINPNHAKSMLLLGDLYAEELLQIDTSRFYYQMVIDRVQPNHFQARHNLCVLWHKQNHLNQAIDCFEHFRQDLIRDSESIDSIEKIERQIEVLIEARQNQWSKLRAQNKLVKGPNYMNESNHLINAKVDTKCDHFKNLIASQQTGVCLI